MPDWTLVEGFAWAFQAVMHRGVEIEGTLRCPAIIHEESGELAVDWTTPGSPASVGEMMPTRDQVRYLQGLLMLLSWIRSGVGYYNNGSILHNGTTTNVQTIGPFTLVSVSGNQVTFNSGASDLRHVSIGTASGTIGPFDQLEFSSNSVVSPQVVGLIKRVVSWGTGAGSNVTVELLQHVDAAAISTDGNPVTVTISAEYIGEPWTHVRELHPLWTIEEGMEVGYDAAEAGDITLVRGFDGTTGKIAIARAESASGYGDCVTPATVSVKKVGTDGIVTDLTASTLARWDSGYDESGEVISTFDGSSLLAEGERLLLRYRMEVEGGWAADQTARITGSDRCKFACRSACDQFNFCAKSRDGSPPSGLDDFPPEGDCHQWGCDGWAPDEPFDWRNLGALINQMILGVPLLEEQAVAGIPTYVMKRHGVSGLAWLLGMEIEATASGQRELTYPPFGKYGTGAFFLDALAGVAEYSTAQVASGDMYGPLSGGVSGTNGLGQGWSSFNDATKGHRCLLRTDRIGVAAREGTADSFSGRGPGDRVRVRNFVSAAVHCDHAEDDAETNESGQVAFTSHADGRKTLRVLPLGSPFEGDGATIATGDVAAAADLGGGFVKIEPSNKPTPISWRDTTVTPAAFTSGTADLGAPGNGMVSCHPAFKLKDSGSGQGTGGTQLRGVIPGDWIEFSGVSGDDAAYIQGRKWLVYRADPFGGGTQDWNYNGGGGDPPADWTGTRPANFATWGKERSRIALEDDGDGTLAANVANLVGADITAVSGGVMWSVTQVQYNGVAIDAGDLTVDGYAGTIEVAADAGGSTGEVGWYRVAVVAFDRRNLPQTRVFDEVVGGIEALEGIWLLVGLTGASFELGMTAQNRHPEEWGPGVSGAVIDQGEEDFSAQFMAAQADTYITLQERHGWSDGSDLEDSGASSYEECPTGSEVNQWKELDAGKFLVRTIKHSIGHFSGVATMEARAGAQVGDNVGARRWRRVVTRQIPALKGMPGGVLRSLPTDSEILGATIDVACTGVSEVKIEANKVGASAGLPYETASTVTDVSSASDAISIELWAERADGSWSLIAGVGGIEISGSGTTTVDVTSILQTWVSSQRGRNDWVNMWWMPGYGELSDFGSIQVAARTGTKGAEYTGCETNPTPPPAQRPVLESIANLSSNDYTDTDREIALSGFGLSNLQVKFALGSSVREMRQMFNPSTGARRDVINP